MPPKVVASRLASRFWKTARRCESTVRPAPRSEWGDRVMADTRLKKHYHTSVVPALLKEFGYSNVMKVPRLEKIVLNASIKEATQNVKLLETAAEELALITGQKAQIRRARKSIANFKLREGMPIGARVT